VLGGIALLASALSLLLTGVFVFLMLSGLFSPYLGSVVVTTPPGRALLDWLDFWPKPLAVLGLVSGLVALGLVCWDARRVTSPGGSRGVRQVQRLALTGILLGVAVLLLGSGLAWYFGG
jgi:hypothetical protein